MKALDRAYSMLEVKSVETKPDVVVIKGMASTPTPDRMGDVVDPMGAVFKTPMPLLWQHDSMQPVGLVTFAKPTSKGIPFTAELPVLTEPGTLKDRIDEAIQSVRLGLVAAVSIGFRVMNDAVEYIAATNGLKFLQWEWYELSLVTIPANAEATIATVKSIDHKSAPPSDGREALIQVARANGAAVTTPRGEPSAGKAGVKLISPGAVTMNVQDQIKQYESTRAAKDAARTKLMEDSAEAGETLNVDQAKQYDDLTAEVDQIDAHLKRLDTMQKSVIAAARPAIGANPDEGRQARGAEPHVIGLAKKLPPGIALARYAICKAISHRDNVPLLDVVKTRYPDMGEMRQLVEGEVAFGGMKHMLGFQKAAVPAATTTDTTWAKPLLAYNTYLEDFISFLRPFTILGKFGTDGIPSLNRIPFNVHIKGQTSGGAGYWVGEGQAKPLTKFDFSDVYLGWYKLAAIVVATEEMMRFANPGMEALLRDQMKNAIMAKMDSSFIDPTFAGTTGVSPPSITSGVTAIAPSGTTAAALRADIAKMWAAWQAVNLDASSPVYIMDSQTAIRLASMRTTLESSKQFPDLSYKGGELDGVPVIVSNYVTRATAGGTLILLNADDIYLADDGEVTIDASREASLVMDSAPTMASGPTAAAAQVVSMFQTNSMALRAERYLNYAKRRSFAVQMINPTAYS